MMIVLNTVLAGCVGYIAFCALHGMSRKTPALKRWAFSAVLAASSATALAPMIAEWSYKPHPIGMASYAVMLLLMVAMMRKPGRG